MKIRPHIAPLKQGTRIIRLMLYKIAVFVYDMRGINIFSWKPEEDFFITEIENLMLIYVQVTYNKVKST